MEDPAFGKGGVYGPGYVPMEGTPMSGNDAVRSDYFDAAAGGIVNNNIPGVNCNPAKEFNMVYDNTPKNNDVGAPTVITGRNGQQNSGYSGGFDMPAKISTEANETVIFHNGKTCIKDLEGNIKPVTINNVLTPEEKVELMAKLIDHPEMEKAVKDSFIEATKKYACGEMSKNDYEKRTMVTSYILSQKKSNQAGNS